ncbi:SH3 domain-containing protein [Rummeliibacillus sp. POC4]|uniref:SH3 domain-containing protein n=1 Tax=Rummeliibacillus sp. POC4 TaxID=2305899 RepID=UPI0013148A95|nr:SH3 domain-containing protein [Rummeliibacillus sp. POC4]
MSFKKLSKFVLISAIASSAVTTYYVENPFNMQELQAKATTANYITTENVKFRQSAGLNGKLLFVLKKGNKVKVTSTKKVGGIYWAKIQWQDHVGWIAKDYLKLYQEPKSSTTNVKETVSTTANVNLRKSASTKTAKLATIPKGTKLTVSKITTSNNMKWAYVSYNGKKGWVSYSYLKKYQATTLTTLSVKETVSTTANVNLRKSATTKSAKLASIPNGTKLTVTKTTTFNNMKWAYVNYNGKKGWVSYSYLKKYQATTLTTLSVKETVSTTANVNLRQSASTKSAILVTIPKGTKLTVSKTTTIDNVKWAYGSYNGKKGWICSSYLKKATTTTVNKQSLVTNSIILDEKTNLYNEPDKKSSMIAIIPNGSELEIKATKIVNKVKWANVQSKYLKGWIVMPTLKN